MSKGENISTEYRWAEGRTERLPGLAADLVRLKVDVIVASRPAGCLGALIAESAAHGLRFVRRLAEEWTSGVNRFDRPGEAPFVAEIDGRIVECGTCTS